MFGHAIKYKECPMRNRGYNCDPVGGDCATGISDELCKAIHAAYNKGFRDGADQMLKNDITDGVYKMTNREKIMQELTYCLNEGKCTKCEYTEGRMFATCRHIAEEVLAFLKEQEIRELTIDEWREWKNNPKRNPICELWENDTSPMWILNPNDVHEPALLMGKLKLFTGKPTFEQCKEVKWE